MKRIFLILFLSTGSFLASCQCSNPPDVPPVEDEGAQSETVAASHTAPPNHDGPLRTFTRMPS